VVYAQKGTTYLSSAEKSYRRETKKRERQVKWLFHPREGRKKGSREVWGEEGKGLIQAAVKKELNAAAKELGEKRRNRFRRARKGKGKSSGPASLGASLANVTKGGKDALGLAREKG